MDISGLLFTNYSFFTFLKEAHLQYGKVRGAFYPNNSKVDTFVTIYEYRDYVEVLPIYVPFAFADL